MKDSETPPQKVESRCGLSVRPAVIEFWSVFFGPMILENLNVLYLRFRVVFPTNEVNTGNDVLIARGVRSQNRSAATCRIWRSTGRRNPVNPLLGRQNSSQDQSAARTAEKKARLLVDESLGIGITNVLREVGWNVLDVDFLDAGEDFVESQLRRLPPSLILDLTEEMTVMQRIYTLALGYEDCNDHHRLRRDLPGQSAGARTDERASCSTLCG